MKNSNDTIGNRIRDLPACSAVPQPTAPPRASYRIIPTSINVINTNNLYSSWFVMGHTKFGTAKISLQCNISGPTSTSRMIDLLSALQVTNLFVRAKTTSGVNSHRGLSEQPTFTAFILHFS